MQRSIKSLQQRTHHCEFRNEDEEPEVFVHRNMRPKTRESLRRRLTETEDKRQELRREAEKQREIKEKEECPFKPKKVSRWPREVPCSFDRPKHECQQPEPSGAMNGKSRAIVQRVSGTKSIWERQSENYARATSQLSNRPQLKKHSKVATERLFKSGIRTYEDKDPELETTTHKTRKEIKESTNRLFQSSIASKKTAEHSEPSQPVLKQKRPIDMNKMENDLKKFVAASDRREREAEYRRQYQEIQDLSECRYAPKDLMIYSQNGEVPRDLDKVLRRRSLYKPPPDETSKYNYRKPLVTRQFSFDKARS